jgi:hypothetical protein
MRSWQATVSSPGELGGDAAGDALVPAFVASARTCGTDEGYQEQG